MPALYFGTTNEQITGLFVATFAAAPGATYLAAATSVGPVVTAQTLINATGQSTIAGLAAVIQANYGLGTITSNAAANAAIVSFLGTNVATAGAGLVALNNAFIGTAAISSPFNATYGTAANTFITSLETGVAYSIIAANNSTNVSTLQAVISSSTGTGGTSATLLTPSVDILSGNNFNGALQYNANTGTNLQTLNTGDTLTGTGTTPTLTAQLTGAATTTPTLTGITNVVLTGLSAGSDVLSGANITGLLSVTNTGSTGTGLSVTGLATAITTLAVTNITAAGATTVTIANSALGVSAAAVLALNLSADTSVGVITVGGTTAAAGVGYTTINLTTSGAGSNVVSQLTQGSATLGNLATLNVAGTANLLIGTLDNTVTTINAAGTTPFSGNLVLGTTGGGLAMTGTEAITGGTGVNKFYINNTVLGSKYTINGGAGTGSNTLVIVGTGAVLGTAATITNEKVLELAGTANNTLLGTGNGGTGYGATALSFNMLSTTGVTTIQMDGAASGNTAQETLNNLALTGAALTLNDIGIGTAGTESFNGLSLTTSATTPTLTWNISDQGVLVGSSNAITVGASVLSGFTTVNLAITNVAAANVTTLGAITDTSLTSFTATDAGGLALGTNAWGALTTLNLSAVAGVETGTFTVAPAAALTSNTLSISAGSNTTAASVITVNDTVSTSATSTTFSLASAGGAIILTEAMSTVAAALTISGVSDNANVSFTETGTAGAAAQTITLGNGNNFVSDAGTGVLSVTTGTGFSTINLTSLAMSGNNSVILGTHTSSGTTIQTNTFSAVPTIDSITVGTSTAAPSATVGMTTITGAVANDAIIWTGTTSTTTAAQNLGTITLAALLGTVLTTATDAYTVNGGITYFVAHNNGTTQITAGDTLIAIVGTHTFNAPTSGGVVLAS